MRTARNRWKTCTLGVVAVAALLSSTACESGGAERGKTPSPSATPSGAGSPSATAGPTPSAAPSTAGSPKPGGGSTPGASKSAGAPTGGGGTTVTACNDNDLSITLSDWRQDSGQHLLITATNLSDKACTLYHYPYVGFGAAIAGPVAPMDSKPQAVATIGPKEKAYAGLFLFRGGQRTVTVEQVSLGYQDRAFNSNKDVAWLDHGLPADIGSLTVGPEPRVTYWNLDLRTVENHMFRSSDS
ncbi:DUF4232 domain-containing protein [Streptomyces sp. NBC_00249]|uniref:DUF4232 domain-containing protein n=1 Tax=Streptomyces sp. NBC_00249 TaxID=2975690 RepID=UPI002258D83E|nr:DUF4232 domain-containing protein [Streptomyces sp. NBC_00249]MCX5197382.1 DUF4232 domain-containing protein [Streptomyces sp. NBC_00249]